MVQIAG